MKKKIQINRIQVARIDASLCKKYLKSCGKKKIGPTINQLFIEAFGIDVKTLEDLEKIRTELNKRYFSSISEWLSFRMRMKILYDADEIFDSLENTSKHYSFTCKDCQHLNFGEEKSIIYDDEKWWDFCPIWNCRIDKENNSGIKYCFKEKNSKNNG